MVVVGNGVTKSSVMGKGGGGGVGSGVTMLAKPDSALSVSGVRINGVSEPWKGEGVADMVGRR